MCFEKHPRRAPRDPLKGAAPTARQSRFRGTPGFGSRTRGIARAGEHT